MVEMDKIVSEKRGWVTCVNPTYKVSDRTTGEQRMPTAREALALYFRSKPSNKVFQISFRDDPFNHFLCNIFQIIY